MSSRVGTMMRLGLLPAITILPAFVHPAARAGDWVAHNEGLRNLTVIGIGIAPGRPDTLYIQARSLGIYRSTDGGSTWTRRSGGIPDADPGLGHLLNDGPVVHPSNPDLAWAVSSGYVYRTTNGGLSWSQSSTGTTVNGLSSVRGIALDARNPDHLFAGTIVSGADGGVFESTNGGISWTNIAGSAVAGSGVGNDAWPIAVDPADPSRLYCGSPHESVYRSMDGGHAWINASPVAGDHGSYEVAVNPLRPAEVWADAANATWMSSDHGVSWTRRTDFDGQAMVTMQWAPSDPRQAYAIAGSTLWRSNDNGATWTARGGIPGGGRCMAVHPADPQTVFVGTWGLGMFRSTDGGDSFQEINSGLPLTTLVHGQHAFADEQVPEVTYCVLTGNVMYRRPNPTGAWQYYSVAPGGYIQIDPHVPSRWYCVGGGVWRSPDSGLHWEAVYDAPDADCFAAWLDPYVPGHLLVGDRHGGQVLDSGDAGANWTVRGTISATPAGFNVFSDLCGDPFDPNVILVAAYPTYTSNRQCGYIWRSGDGGGTWTQIRDQMFYGHWRIGDGEWSVYNGVLRQRIKAYCNYRVALDNQVFGDGDYQCRMRLVSSNNNDGGNWVGFLIRQNAPGDSFGNPGWLVYLRKNGVIALYNSIDGPVINAAQVPIVPDPGQWTTVRLNAQGNRYELFVNGASVGAFADPNHRSDGPGYFGLVTCQAEGEYDDVDLDAGGVFKDSFSVSQQYGASYSRWFAVDRHEPGVFGLSTQGGGVWRSVDHGLTWQRITGESGEGLVNYRPVFSNTHAGNLYVCRGAGYTWTIDNYHHDGASRQQLGRTISYSSLNVAEDPFDPNRLYAAVYANGILVYEGTDVAGELPPIAADFDGDKDVDQEDFGHLQACLSGPGIAQSAAGCLDARLDDDLDVDASDVLLFGGCLSGPGLLPARQCWWAWP